MTVYLASQFMNIRRYANENNKANKLGIFEKKMIEN